jgi:hypothetical protein
MPKRTIRLLAAEHFGEKPFFFQFRDEAIVQPILGLNIFSLGPALF